MPQVSPFALFILSGLLVSVVAAWIWAIVRLALSLPVLPVRRTRVVPWGPISVLAALLLWVASQMVSPAVYRLLVAAPAPPRPAAGSVLIAASPGEMMTFSAIANALTLLIVPLVLGATAGATRRDFGIEGPGVGRQIGRGLIAYPLLAPVVFGTMLICILIWKNPTQHPLQEAIRLDRSAKMATILVLAGVVLAPAAEELIFRGVLLGWLTRVALGLRGPGRLAEADVPSLPGPGELPTIADLIDQEPDAEVTVLAPDAADPNPYSAPMAPIGESAWPAYDPAEVSAQAAGRGWQLLGANLIVSLIFAALHGAVWPTPIPIFFLSLGLGLLYQRTGSILGPIALHMTFNGVSTLMMFLTAGMNPSAPAKAPTPVPPPAFAIPVGDVRRYPGQPCPVGDLR